MNINVNNLDLGYQQCEDLHRVVSTKGESLLNDLSRNINNLKIHWIGSDASAHINNLIKVYESLIALLTDAKAVSADAASKIIAIQEVRNSNGGGGMVGSMLPNTAPNAPTIGYAESTTEYYVDPAANSDYKMLQNICSEYISFRDQFRSVKDELMHNWTAGANREQAEANFNEFESNSDAYNKYLTDARDNLGIAVSNISQL